MNRHVDLGDAEDTTEFEVLSEQSPLRGADYNPETEEFEAAWESQTLPMAILFSWCSTTRRTMRNPISLIGTVTRHAAWGRRGRELHGRQETGAQ